MNPSQQQLQGKTRIRRLARSGFSLTEILVVILIIVVLAGVTLIVVSKVRRSASSAVCVTKMRQIGSTLAMYAQENNGRLPTSGSYGTLFGGQGPWYNRDNRRLQNHLREYLGAPESSTWSTQGAQMTFDASFAWPALLSYGQTGAASVLLNTSVEYRTGETLSKISPWSGTKPDGGAFVGRFLDRIENPTRTRVFVEVDQQNTTAGWRNLQPTEPIHGTYRNCLYFDWHVDRLPVNP